MLKGIDNDVKQTYALGMKTAQEVFDYFGGVAALAKKLGISRTAVYLWGDYIPESRAYQIESISNGHFKADELPVKKKAAA